MRKKARKRLLPRAYAIVRQSIVAEIRLGGQAGRRHWPRLMDARWRASYSLSLSRSRFVVIRLSGDNLPVTSKTTIAHCASDLDNYRLLAGTLIRLWSLHLPVSPRPTICALLDQLALGTASPDLSSLCLQKTQQRSRSFVFTNTQLTIRPALDLSWADCLALPFHTDDPLEPVAWVIYKMAATRRLQKVCLSAFRRRLLFDHFCLTCLLRFRNFKSWRLRVCVVSVTFRWMSTIFSRG